MDIETWTEKAQQTGALLTAIVAAGAVVGLPIQRWIQLTLERRRATKAAEKSSAWDQLVKAEAEKSERIKALEESLEEEREERLSLLTDRLSHETERADRAEAFARELRELQAAKRSMSPGGVPTTPKTPLSTASRTFEPKPSPTGTRKP